jgi:hypothetical protein
MKTLFKKIFQFFIFSNLFIALCAAIMVWQAKQFIQFPVNIFPLQLFLFFATLTSYSFHWYLTKAEQGNMSVRITWLLQNKKIHLPFFCLGFAGSVILFFTFLQYWQWFLPAVLLTFLYSAPKISFVFFQFIKKIIIAKTLLLSIVWAYVTTALPFIIDGGKWQWAYTIFCLYRFSFIMAICILFDVRDKAYDSLAGIRNMVTWFPLKTVKIIFWIMIVFNVISIGTMFYYNTKWTNLLAELTPTIILVVLLKPALKTNNDYLFYVVLDGLMALSAMLLYGLAG